MSQSALSQRPPAWLLISHLCEVGLLRYNSYLNKALMLGRWLSGQSACLTSLRTRVQILKTHKDAGWMWGSACSSSLRGQRGDAQSKLADETGSRFGCEMNEVEEWSKNIPNIDLVPLHACTHICKHTSIHVCPHTCKNVHIRMYIQYAPMKLEKGNKELENLTLHGWTMPRGTTCCPHIFWVNQERKMFSGLFKWHCFSLHTHFSSLTMLC